MDSFGGIIQTLSRRKPMHTSHNAPEELNRCLTTYDLIAIGVGSMLSHGIYILPGKVAAEHAGPAVIISYLIAAIASLPSALCYMEFAVKVPRCGSVYDYTYITMGEIAAFSIGWTLLLTYSIEAAHAARMLSRTIFMEDAMMVNIPNPGILEKYLGEEVSIDIVAFVIVMLIAGLFLFGIKAPSRFQVTFVSLHVCLISIIVVCAFSEANFNNWSFTKSPTDIEESKFGKGGFFPFGMRGVIVGASPCFFAFVGFDRIAAAAEEIKNTRTAIPISITCTYAIAIVAYCCMAAIPTLLWPYWNSNTRIPTLVYFDEHNMQFSRWIVVAGWIVSMSTNLVGYFLPVPRTLFAMARDGLIHRFLSSIGTRFKVPTISTLAAGLLVACLASKFNEEQLVEMLSLGSVSAYLLVSTSILLIRYEHRATSVRANNGTEREISEVEIIPPRSLISIFIDGTRETSSSRIRRPDEQTTHISRVMILLLVILSTLFNIVLITCSPKLYQREPITISLLTLLCLTILAISVLLNRMPTVEPNRNSFEVPMVPFIPLFNIMLSTYMMLNLSIAIWTKFISFLFFGLCIYYKYGKSHSSGYQETHSNAQELVVL